MLRPTPFGKYLLLDRVNVGGMAEVFKAKHFGVEGFERTVALKRILANIAEDRDFIEMFIDEAKVASQLNHANIAQIFELGKQDGSYFIAMEYVAGRDLRSLFDRAKELNVRVPMELTCYVMLKVCEGLDYAHNKRDAKGNSLEFIHRDVSPQNVMVSFDGDVKLIDFGLAKATTNDYKTQAGILKGKFGYMSPEQIMGLPIERRSDVFSAGIVLYEMLTGRRAFYGESDFATLELVRDVKLEPPRSLNPEIPEALERIVLRALAKDRELRYQTAMDLHDDLQAFMYGVGSFFQRKDLATTMERFFAEEVAREHELAAAHRDMRLDSFESPPKKTQSMTKKVPPPIPASASKAPPAITAPPANTAPPAVKTPPAVETPPAMPSAAPAAAKPPAAKSTLLGMPAIPVSHASKAVIEKPAPIQPSSAPGLEWDDDDEATAVFDRNKHSFSVPPAEPRASIAPVAAEPAKPVVPQPARPSATPQPAAPKPAAQPTSPQPATTSARPSAAKPAPTPSGALPAVTPMPMSSRSEKPAAPSRASGGSGLLFASALIGIAAVAFGAYMMLRPPAPASVELTAEPMDAEVWIDGEIYAKSSPFVITGLDPRVPHLLEVRAEGHKAYKTRMEVGAGETKVWPHVVLRPEGAAAAETADRLVAVSFSSEPSGAEVTLVRGDERRDVGATPVDAQVDVGGERWTVEMRLEGHQTWAGPLSVPAGRDALALSASLKQTVEDDAALEATARPATPVRPAAAPRAQSTASKPKAAAAAKSAEATTTAAPAQTESETKAETGTLTLNTKPGSQVLLGGKSIGHTPIMNHSVPAGRHTLTFVNEQFDVRKDVTVTVAPGESVRRILDLTQE